MEGGGNPPSMLQRDKKPSAYRVKEIFTVLLATDLQLSSI